MTIEPNSWGGLLRACGERPPDGCAADKRDELATLQPIKLHSIPTGQDRVHNIELARLRQVVCELFHKPVVCWPMQPEFQSSSPS